MRFTLQNSGLLFSLCAALVATAVSTGNRPTEASPSTDAAQKAYQLRMNGEAGKAKVLLEKALVEEPGQAAAQYEMARTLLHMGLANPQELMESIEQAHQAIEKATKGDPDNVIYRFFAGRIAFFRAYVAMEQEDATASERVAEMLRAYEEVVRLKADYEAALLYLVEIYQTVPPEIGGNSSKAEEYAASLAEVDDIAAVKARALLLPEETDLVAYWQDVISGDEENAVFLEELGRVYLYNDQPREAAECYRKAIQLDLSRTILSLDLGRYYVMASWKDESRRTETLPLARVAVEEYLAFGPIRPLRAFALGLQSRIVAAMGDEALAEELVEEAAAADPYFSKAFGVPTLDLFVPPEEIAHTHRYLFRPY